MINDKLLDYVRQQIGRGVPKDAIRQALVSSGGWVPSDVDAALAAAAASPDIGAPAPGSAGAPTKYAGFWIRAVALLVDGAILALPSMVVQAALGAALLGALSTAGSASSLDGARPVFSSFQLLASLVAPLISLTYLVLFTYYKGATPGKMLVGIMVRSEDLSRLSFGKVALREIVGRLLCQFTFGIGYVVAAFAARKRGLHDMISGSVVIYQDPTKQHTGRIVLAVFVGMVIPGLVTIAIISILSSVVLVSLGSAREKSMDARAMSDVQQIRTILESSFDGSKYPTAADCHSGAFATSSLVALVADVEKNGHAISCKVTDKAYAISTVLSVSTNSPKGYCIDSSGSSGSAGIDFSDSANPRCAVSATRIP